MNNTTIVTPQSILATYTLVSQAEGDLGTRVINIHKYKLEKLDKEFLDRINSIVAYIECLNLDTLAKSKKGALKVIQIDLADLQEHLESRISVISSKFFPSIAERIKKKALKRALRLTSELEAEVMQIDTVVSRFSRDKTVKGKMRKAIKKILAPAVNALAFKSRRKIFVGWTEAEQYEVKKLEKKYRQLEGPLIEMQKEKRILVAELDAEEADLNALQQEAESIRRELAKIEDKIDVKAIELLLDQNLVSDLLSFSPDYQNYLKLKQEDEEITEELKALEEGWNSSGVSQKIEDLQKRIKDLDEKISNYRLNVGIVGVQNKIDKLKAHTPQKREEFRQRLEGLGGERARIVDEQSHSILDGMYFSADKFKESLNKADITFAFIQVNDTQTVKGFLIKEENLSDEKKASLLEKLKLLENLGLYNCYQTIEADDALFICPKEDVNAVNKALANQGKIQSISFYPTHTVAGGTVLLAQGNGGIYEIYAWEILAFLLRGMDVFAVNFAGFGDSSGIPSESTLKSNMKAMYNHLQVTHPVKDSQLLIKGLCMSGGLAAYLAAKHPEAHLFLDQTYADFRRLAHDELKADIDHFIDAYATNHPNENFKKQFVLWGAKQLKELSRIIKITIPAWETQKEITKVLGHIAILSTKDDETISEEHVQANLKAAVSSKSVTHIKMTGDHAEAWIEAEEDGPFALMQNEKGFRIPDRKEAAKIIEQFEEKVAENEDLNDLLQLTWRQSQLSREFLQQAAGASIFESTWNLFRKCEGLNKGDFIRLVEEEENFYLAYTSNPKIQDQIRALIRGFLTAIFHVNIEMILKNPSNEQNSLHSGREQVDQFLKNAGLIGNLFV